MPATQKATSAKSKSVNGSAISTTENISLQMEELKGEISTITERLAKLGENAVAKGERVRIDGQEKAQDALDTAYLHALDIEQKASDTVREKPLQTIGLAIGLGFIAALAMRR